MSKSSFYKLSLLLLSIIFSLFIAELLLASFGVNPYVEPNPAKGVNSFQELVDKGEVKGIYGHLNPDDELGYTHNWQPHGFNDEKNFYNDWSDYTRVLVLGDSFAEGYSAQPGKGFVDLLNNNYEKQGVLFFNTGVGGYGQNNQLAVLKKYFSVIKPHMVILCFYPGNDFSDNLTPVDRFTAIRGDYIPNYEIIYSRDDIKTRRRTKDEIFVLYKYGKYGHTSLNSTRLGALAQRTLYMMNKAANRLWARDVIYQTTLGYILEIKEFLSLRDVPLHVLIIPDTTAKNKFLKEPYYSDAVLLFEELSIPYVDPFPYLTRADYTKPTKSHWNDDGHFKAYELLKEHIDGTGLLN